MSNGRNCFSASGGKPVAWIQERIALRLACPLLLILSGSANPALWGNCAVAQEIPGGQSAERAADSRRSPEGDSDRRQATERAAGQQHPDVGGRSPLDALRDFKPQTDREAILLQMILQLQRKITQLRQDGTASAERDRLTAARTGEREGGRSVERRRGQRPVAESNSSADANPQDFPLPANWQRTKAGKVFLAYDKNRDLIVSLDEWLAMTNGNLNEQRRAISTKHFHDAEPSGDGKFTPAEFIWWRQTGSRQSSDRARSGRDPAAAVDRGSRTGSEETEGRSGRAEGEKNQRSAEAGASGEAKKRRSGEGSEGSREPRE
ncbi:MAG: hypothetical protein ACO3FE_04525 [Planctomycetaceae bacterium]